MSKKSLKKNYIYHLIYQIFTIILPLITAPYLARVLDSDGAGKNAFVSSIVGYFTLVAALGFANYATREISGQFGDKVAQSKTFWEILILRSLSTIVAFGAYIVCIFSFSALRDYQLLLLIYGVSVINVGLENTFLLRGNEDFKQITIRDFFIKTLSVVCIFVFVRTRSDLWVYALIIVGSTSLSYLVLLPYLSKYLTKVKLKELHPMKHLRPVLWLFVPAAAISVYTVLDKTMIGALVPGTTAIIENGEEIIKKIADIENGYYEQAEKIVKTALTLITALGAVMLPRNSEYFKAGLIDKVKENIYKSTRFIMFLGVPIMFGIAAIAVNFSGWFFGEGYDKVPYIMMIISPVVLFIGLSNVLGIQYLIPSKKDVSFTISVLAGGAVNLTFNAIFIPMWYSYGAAFGTIIAELVVLLIQILIVRKEFNWWSMVKTSLKYWIAGGIMFVSVFVLSLFLSSQWYWTLVLVSGGILLYFGSLYLFRDDLLFSIIRNLKLKLKRNRQ